MSTPSHARLGLIQVSLAGILWGTGGLGVQIIRQALMVSTDIGSCSASSAGRCP